MSAINIKKKHIRIIFVIANLKEDVNYCYVDLETKHNISDNVIKKTLLHSTRERTVKYN